MAISGDFHMAMRTDYRVALGLPATVTSPGLGG